MVSRRTNLQAFYTCHLKRSLKTRTSGIGSWEQLPGSSASTGEVGQIPHHVEVQMRNLGLRHWEEGPEMKILLLLGDTNRACIW